MVLVAGIDSSTQSTKVEVRDADTGRVWGAGQRSHPATTPPCSEQHPGSWWAALVQAWHDAGRYDVAAVAVAGQQHAMVILDDHGTVVRPAKLWNDTESAPDAASLVDSIGRQSWVSAAGSVPRAAFTVAKLAWLRRVEPESFLRMHHVLLPHDWLTWRLTGRFVTDRGDASGTGYWSPREGRWRFDILRLIDDSLDWVERLPVVLAPTEAAGPIAPTALAPLGLEGREVIVGPGTGDNMAAALGLGLGIGDVLVSVGTSGVVAALSDVPIQDSSGSVAGFADATGRWLPLVCTMNATKVTDTFARLLNVDHDRFAQLALQAPAGAGGLVCVPYLDGERTPDRPDATGSLLGMRNSMEPGHVARAAIEGVVCGLLDGLDALTSAGLPAHGLTAGRLVLAGGGARSRAYQQVLADLTGRPVTLPPAGIEPVATGACVQAAAVLAGCSPDEVARAWGLGDGLTIDPNPDVDGAEVRAAYARARDGS